MATVVYALCALTSALCAAALILEFRRQRTRLLLWSSLSFVGLAISNALVFTDFIILPDIDLSLLRASTTAVATALLVFGLVWGAE